MATREYPVEIPIVGRDETGPAVASAEANLSRINQRSQLEGQAHYRLMHQLADRDVRQQEQNAARALAAENRKYKEMQALQRQVDRERRRSEQDEANAANRRMAWEQRAAREEAAAANRRRAYAQQQARIDEQNEARRLAALRRQDAEEAAAANRRSAYARRIVAEEAASEQATAGRTRQFGMGASMAGRAMTAAGTLLTATVTAPILGGLGFAVKEAAQLDQYERALMAVMGTAEATKKKLAELHEVAKLPGISFEQTVQGQVRLQAVGFGADFATRSIRALANAIALVGGSPEKLESITIQLGQMAGKSKIVMADLRPIIEASPAIATAMRNAFGTIDPGELTKKFGNSQKFIEALIAAIEKLPTVTGGAMNAMTNFGDTISVNAAKIGQRFLPLLEKVLDYLSDAIPHAIDASLQWWDSLGSSAQTAIGIIVGLAVALGPVLVAVGGVVTAIGTLIASLGFMAYAVGGVGALLSGAAEIIGVVTIAAAVLAAGVYALYVAWEHNWGQIREITAATVSYIQDGWTALSGILINAWNRLYPTLASITSKALGVIGSLWGDSSTGIVAAIQYAHDTLLPIMKGILGTILNVVELVARIIDGDWRGAWETFSVILYNAVRVWGPLLVEAGTSAVLALLNKWLDMRRNFIDTAQKWSWWLITTTATEIILGAPHITQAIEKVLAIAAINVNPANIAMYLGAAVIEALQSALSEGEREAERRRRAALARLGPGTMQEQGSDLIGDSVAIDPRTGRPIDQRDYDPWKKSGGGSAFTFDTTPSDAASKTDPAIEQLAILNDYLATVNKKAEESMAKLDRLYKFGIVGITGYAMEAARIETVRHEHSVENLEKQMAVALTKRKANGAAISEVEKKQGEESKRHSKAVGEIEDAELNARLDRFRREGEVYLSLLETQDSDITERIKRSVDGRTMTHAAGEAAIQELERAALQRQDDWFASQQQLYAIDSDKFQEFADKRIAIADKMASNSNRAFDRMSDAIKQDIARLEEFDEMMTRVDRDNMDSLRELNERGIDRLEKSGADPDYVRQLRLRQQADDHYEDRRRDLIAEKARALATAVGDEREQVEEVYREKSLRLEQLHQVRLEEVMLDGLYRYAEKVHEVATSIGSIFGDAFSGIIERGDNFFRSLAQGFRRLFSDIVRDFIMSRVRNYIESLFNPVYAQTHGAGGGGTGLNFASIAGMMTGGGGGGGLGGFLTGGFAGGASPAAGMMGGGGAGMLSLAGLGGLGGGGDLSSIITPGALSGSGSLAGLSPELRRQLSLQALDYVESAGTVSMGGGGIMGALRGFGPMAPLMGLGIGQGLGGSSRGGQVFGGIGGLLGGGLVSGLLGSGGLFGGGLTSGGGVLGGMVGNLSTFLGLGTGVLGAATLGIGAAVAVIGGMLLSRNAKRKEEEKSREVAWTQAGSAIWALISEAHDGDMSMATAESRWHEIDVSYHNQISSLTDKKTRHNAELWWTQDAMPLHALLMQAATESEGRARARIRMEPVFGGGGWNWQDQLIRVRPGEGMQLPGERAINVVPGRDLGYDSVPMFAPKGTRILTRGQMDAGEGYSDGGIVGEPRTMATGGSPVFDVSVDLSGLLDGLVSVVINSKEFGKSTIRNVKLAGLKNKRMG